MLAFRRESLTSRNTFGIKASAAQFADVTSVAGLRAWAASRTEKTQPLVIGGGSNLLITRDVVEEPVLHIAPRGIRILEDAGESVLVEAMAGEPWHAFVLWTLAQGLCGLENLSLIPGYVGAAPVQNIGAYGVEIKDTCERVIAIDLRTGAERVFTREECAFGYRDSVFKRVDREHPRDRFVIVSVRFRLSRAFVARTSYGEIQAELESMQLKPHALAAMDVSRAVIAIRSRKLPDPAVIGNAGSFFKNPIVSHDAAEKLVANFPDAKAFRSGQATKIAAGWLIEKAGWKGRLMGRAGVHKNHALVLVNHGGASGAELWALAQAIRFDVKEKFDIELEPEPRIV
ncbi:MAG: UDP-N-acetylmuramate dehydrogenase [Betaproteobacteria bacterium]|nr:MAG: UDP-N-acetylmuramate dehydrogenase [Betaproteobacteria bacterium]